MFTHWLVSIDPFSNASIQKDVVWLTGTQRAGYCPFPLCTHCVHVKNVYIHFRIETHTHVIAPVHTCELPDLNTFAEDHRLQDEQQPLVGASMRPAKSLDDFDG